MDLPTSNKIAQLHPSVRNEVQKIINECDKVKSTGFSFSIYLIIGGAVIVVILLFWFFGMPKKNKFKI